MASLREQSQQDRRVYVGNLSYDVKWHHLKDFMRQAGEVLFADVLLLPNGMSKGCGIVEYATREQAQHAVQTLSNQNLMGRLVYVREDREAEPRFTAPPSVGRGGYGGMRGGGRQLYVSNLPYNVGWQDLKDLFRQAAHTGSVIRADVHQTADGRMKGSGIVVFETPEDARNAIQQFNGYDWQGRALEVKEDRFAGPPGFGFGGGMGYDAAVPAGPPNPFTDYATAGGERSNLIYAVPAFPANCVQLPWSTSNEDLVELFTTIGKVERAEIQYEPNGRSRGTGVVEFDSPENAETAISKFTGYQYGGRPLGLSFVKYTNISGPGDAMETEAAGLTQDQIM
ncbi:hypothetical protein HDK77DRAFT_378671 [Phyllosticta capitalensis]